MVFVSAGDALLSGVHGLLALRALRVFDGLERHVVAVLVLVGLYYVVGYFRLGDGNWGMA